MDERIPVAVFSIKFASNKRKKIEIFSAKDWKHWFKPWKVSSFHPRPPLNNSEWWEQMYRVRIDRKWHTNHKNAKYCFFTQEEINEIIWRDHV